MTATPKPFTRAETGATQIGDDWPGVFIRGDSALMGYAPALEALIEGRASVLQELQCKDLLKLLHSANAHAGGDIQVITPKTD